MRAVAAVAFLFSFAASTLAYSVNTPDAQQGWNGVLNSQDVSWSRVDTDPQYFAIVLDNQSIQGFQPKVLESYVDGTAGDSTTVYPPDGAWPTGSNFRVNFVKSPGEIHTIYAQSDYFSIN